MDERTLVAFDGSPLSQRALERAIAQHPAGPIVVLYVVDPLVAVYEAETEGPGARETFQTYLDAVTDEVRADAEAIAADLGYEVETVTAVGRPDREILAYARDNDVDHIVMGSHGRRGVSRLVLGSVAERVLLRAPVPVTVVR
jgi:nucleotide-binding universal stress UspA family protein